MKAKNRKTALRATKSTKYTRRARKSMKAKAQRTATKQQRTSTRLPKEVVKKKYIAKLKDARLKRLALRELNKKVRERHGSTKAGKISDRDRKNMLAMHRDEASVSFRAIEVIYHLIPANGNDAKRQVDRALALEQEEQEEKARLSQPQPKPALDYTPTPAPAGAAFVADAISQVLARA